MRGSILIGSCLGVGLLAAGAAPAGAQAPPAAVPVPATRVSMADAVRLALEHNHQLRAQRLNVDISKADEITAGVKPNPVITSTNENFPVFAPRQFGSDLAGSQNFVESMSYLFERGGKRRNRVEVAQAQTTVTAQTTADAERQLTFQTRQAFINVLLAQSTLALARENLDGFSNVVEVNRLRVAAGDLAEADFYKILLQKLQFEQDVASGEVALVQAKAALRQDVGVDALAPQFDVEGDLAFVAHPATLEALQRDALASRPDLQAAHSGVSLAQHTESLAYSNRVRDVTGGVEYDRSGPINALGFSVSIDVPIHDRNQGNIAHGQVAIRQAEEAEAQARSTVLTDVATAFSAFEASEKVVSIFQSGYLDRAKQSLDITTYVFQNGSGTLLDLLDAERTYRDTELAYRQALAAYMTSAEQVNFAVGKQVMP